MRKSHAKKAGAGGVSGSTGGRHLGADNAASFHATYSAQYLQRYSDLFQALAAPGQHVALLNAFATVHDVEDAGLTKRVGGQEAAGAGGPISCFRCVLISTSVSKGRVGSMQLCKAAVGCRQSRHSQPQRQQRQQ